MNKGEELINSQLRDALLKRFAKMPHYQYLRCTAMESADNSRIEHLFFSQPDMEEVDLNWEPWDIWMWIYADLIEEGLLNPHDADPSLQYEGELREHFKNYGPIQSRNYRQQLSLIAASTQSSPLKQIISNEDPKGGRILLNLDALALHLTKAAIEKLANEITPNWATKITSASLLVSTELLTTKQQADELAVKLKRSVLQNWNIRVPEVNCIYSIDSRAQPGIFRVVINLDVLTQCCPPSIPDKKPYVFPFKSVNKDQDEASQNVEPQAPRAELPAANAGDVIKAFDSFHLVLRLNSEASSQSDEAVVDNTTPDLSM